MTLSEKSGEGAVGSDLAISETEFLSTAQNRHLRLKADLVVLPIMVIASTLAFLDKVIFPFSCSNKFHVSNFVIRTGWRTRQCMASRKTRTWKARNTAGWAQSSTLDILVWSFQSCGSSQKCQSANMLEPCCFAGELVCVAWRAANPLPDWQR